MREIKFRAWEKTLKEMISVHDIDFEMKMINTESAWRTFNDIELMQFTGLTDKNGKEIYEGDILRHDFKNEKKEWDYVLRKVKYNDNDYDYGGRCIGFDVNGFWGNNFYVVGNIHANPELIKGGVS